MNDPDTSHSDTRPRSDEGHREAPSAIINACHSQVKWHLVHAIVSLAVFVTVPVALYHKGEQIRLFLKINNQPPSAIPDCVIAFGGACGLFAILNALFLFRCASAMRTFAESRRIADLHRAMCRLRTVWRFFGIFLLLAVAGLTVWWIYEASMRQGPTS